MKTTKTFELEIERHNVTPAQFLAYVRQQTKRKGISFDMSSADFAREGWSFGYMNALPSEKPCNAETGTDKPYNKQTYIRNFDGTTYNEIIEFQFDDDKTGFGYYYTVQIDVADEDREANTAETIAHTIANRAKKAEAQEARAAKIEAEADEAEARGYAAQWWIEAQRTEAAKLRREAAATREAITASSAQPAAEAPETAEETESEEQTTTTAHPVPVKLAREYDARTYTNRDKWQRCRLPEWGSLCNTISWRWYHSAAEEATPATTATEAAPLQLETLAARLDRMTAAELVNLYAATSAPGSIDDETDSAIYDALRASNPRAYRVWMKTSIEYNPGDPASIEAANAADVERLRAAYGVTA